MKKLLALVALVAMVTVSSVAYAATTANVAQDITVSSTLAISHDAAGTDCSAGLTLALDPLNAVPVYLQTSPCDFLASSNNLTGFTVNLTENQDPTNGAYTISDMADTTSRIIDGKDDGAGAVGTMEEYGYYTSSVAGITDAVTGTCNGAVNSATNWCVSSGTANGVVNGTDDVAFNSNFEVTFGAAGTVATESGLYENTMTLTIAVI